ncbi:DUF4760 domain-containing protein [Lysobacter soli]|uniref:DUF4760 domain-containing protein n=1 Tax=Lysobacter soli TaxID=453783 RepID=UPI0012EEB8CD|nr:DUF4760 domain-containing protein [Lysobacter soli]QGW65917.1 DUF4760 domain-containing protein [Lysobacter soli]
MEHVFKDLKVSQAWAWIALIVCGVLLAALIFSPVLTPQARGGLAIAAYLALAIYFWPCLLAAAHKDHRHLLTVVIWSFVLVILGIATSFYSFFAIAGDEHVKYDKLLNVVPVFVAIWAAAVGWLIHFKLTSKAHRTNNAFAIIMETRKSSEFLKRAELVSRHFPPGTRTIPKEYHEYFDPGSLKKLLDDKAAGRPVADADLEKAEAIASLKYILNYYEFMAVGIRVGDLDETLVFDTISNHVVKLFERSTAFVNYNVNPDNNGSHPKTYCDLRDLVQGWKTKAAIAGG